jgi:Flp pilus assembly protein TadD
MRMRLTVLAVVLLGAAAAADVVHLKDGRKIEGKVTDLGDKIRIERSFGSMTIDKTEVDRIEVKAFAEGSSGTAKASPGRSRPRYKVRMVHTVTSIDLNCVVFHPSSWGGNSPVIRGPIPGPTEGGSALRLDWSYRKSAGAVEEEMAGFKKQIESDHPGATFSNEQSFSLGGRPTVQFEASYAEKDRKKTELVQLSKNGETLAIFRFAAEDAAFDKRWHEVNLMLRSLKWFKRQEISAEKKEQFLDTYEKGYKAMGANRPQEALALYKECAAIVSEIGVIQSAIGQAYLAMKDYRNAVVAIQKALQFEPENTIAMWQLAMSYYYWGKEEEATNAFKRVMEADPENDEAFMNAGILYANRQKWFEAKDVWKRGALKNPDSVELHLRWGEAAERCEKPAEAREAYEKVLKLQPANGEAKKRLEELRKAK